MPERPSGAITFLFTDIEGSTQLWEQQPKAMQTALARHDALLRQAIQARDGYVFKTVGDAFYAAFASPAAALAAALDIQRVLAAPTTEMPAEAEGLSVVGGPSSLVLRVRVALHSGATEERDGDYFGPPLNRVARLLAAGYGGQILLSQATYELVRDRLPEGVGLTDLGEHRLKDLARPERLYQVTAPDLLADFPPLKTLDARPGNLPAPLTSLVGRETERAAVGDLLLSQAVRLVCLTGPGGTGKTRLALAVAQDLIEHPSPVGSPRPFADGVFFVSLALVDDPNLVASTITRTLNLREEPGRPPLDTLLDTLRGKSMLLVLDNLEQVMAAASLITALLTACATLRILATSREVLGLSGAYTFEVAPLAAPPPDQTLSLAQLAQFPAIDLFVQRARAVRPDFSLTSTNARAISAICHRLDGLPLAIELAAARIRLLSPDAMLRQMEHSLQFLTSSARDLPPRQRTLTATLDWSNRLLSEEDSALFCQLAVFAGGFTLAAAEAVCHLDDHPTDILEPLSSLVDKSLIRSVIEDSDEGSDVDASPRFAMLKTIRDYALAQLAKRGEAEAVRERHAAYYVALAEEAEPHLRDAAQVTWLARLERENDNLRAALAWSETTRRHEAGWRLATALLRFWMHSSLIEARSWLERLIRLGPPGTPTRAWAGALFSQAAFSFYVGDVINARAQFERSEAAWESLGDHQGLAYSLIYHSRVMTTLGDFAAARALAERSLALFHEVGDQWGVAEALHNLGHVDMEQGDFEAPRVHFQHSVALFRALGDRVALTGPLSDLGQIAYQRGDYQEARDRFEESLVISSQLGDHSRLAYWLSRLGDLARSESDDEQAKAYYEDSLAIYHALGSQFIVPTLLHNLGYIAQHQGRYAEARDLFSRTLEMLPPPGRERERAQCLAGLAAVLAAEGQPGQAAILFGAAQIVLSHSPPATPADRDELERTAATLRGLLGEAEWEAQQAQGRAMTLEQAITRATEES